MKRTTVKLPDDLDMQLRHEAARRHTQPPGASTMVSDTLDALLKLPASDRADIAMALWESLTDAERETEVHLSDEQKAELDRRWEQYLANPAGATPWEVVKARLRHRR